jgi:hypothetical protein
LAYLTTAEFDLINSLPGISLDEIENNYPGWLSATLVSFSAVIDARLAKRYATPFASPVSEQVKNWLVRLVNIRVLLKVGTNSNDSQVQILLDDANLVLAELKEAADAKEGLYDLPLRADTNVSGITKPTILTTSDPNPYIGLRTQATRSYGR